MLSRNAPKKIVEQRKVWAMSHLKLRLKTTFYFSRSGLKAVLLWRGELQRRLEMEMMTPVSVILVTSSPARRARSVVTYRPSFTVVSALLSEDDAKVDYTSLLDLEDRRKRFSEDVVDKNLKDSIRIKKMYRDLQRQVHGNGTGKPTSDSSSLEVKNSSEFLKIASQCIRLLVYWNIHFLSRL